MVRSLGLRSACSVVAGSVIGSGVFLVAADISRALPSPTPALSVWVSAGLLSLIGGLTFAELGALYPGTGGQYLYLREAFGPLAAFLYGWTQFLVIQAGSIAAVSIAFAQFCSALIPLSAQGVRIAASAVIVLLTLINALGVKKGAWVLDWITGLKVAALIGVAAAGLCLGAGAEVAPAAAARWDLPSYGVALIAAFWAYDGWNNVTFVSGEIREPQRNIPLALLGGISAVMLLYVGANAAYYRTLPASAIAASSFPAADAARSLAGPTAAGAMGILVLLSTLGCVNGMILAGPRVTYAMAEDKTLPSFLAYVHPRHRVPTGALLAQMAWSVLLVWSGRYDQLFTYVIGAAFIFYGLAGAAVFVLRRLRPGLKRPYEVPLYPYLPGLYIAFTAAFVLNTVREKPSESLAGLGIVALGLPVYFYFTRKRRDTSSAGA